MQIATCRRRVDWLPKAKPLTKKAEIMGAAVNAFPVISASSVSEGRNWRNPSRFSGK